MQETEKKHPHHEQGRGRRKKGTGTIECRKRERRQPGFSNPSIIKVIKGVVSMVELLGG